METTINAMIVLDADGNRICSKYYTPAFIGNSPKQVRFPPREPPRARQQRGARPLLFGTAAHALFAGPPLRPAAPLLRFARSQIEFELKLHQKTRGSSARPDAEIMLMDGTIAVFRSSVDAIFYVIGHAGANELILGHLLEGLFESVSGLLKGQVEKILLLENLELLLLAMDELVDKGMILETDPLAVANRVLMRGIDGDEPVGDWTQLKKGAELAKQALERAFRQ